MSDRDTKTQKKGLYPSDFKLLGLTAVKGERVEPDRNWVTPFESIPKVFLSYSYVTGHLRIWRTFDPRNPGMNWPQVFDGVVEDWATLSLVYTSIVSVKVGWEGVI